MQANSRKINILFINIDLSPIGISIALKLRKFYKKTFRGEKNMADGDGTSTGNNLIWAITTLIIVAIIAGALYYSGILSGKQKPNETDVKINVTAPAR
jgi:hypothetical protein